MSIVRPFSFDVQLSPAGTVTSPAVIDQRQLLGAKCENLFSNPIVFGRTIGFLYPGAGPIGVVLLSAIGFEEMCVRSTWRTLAEEISLAGLPCLRFDYPGTGDALDPDSEPNGLEDWYETAHEACALLRQQMGCERIILLGQGIGAMIAAKLSGEIKDVDSCVLLNPVLNGKRYIRELSAWARMLIERIGIAADPDDDTGCAVAGLSLAPGRLAEIAKLNIADLSKNASSTVLLAGRPNDAGQEALAVQMEARGARVARLDYEGIDNLMTDPTQAAPPLKTIEKIVDWIAGRNRLAKGSNELRPLPNVKAARHLRTVLESPHFVERPVRFGPGGRLFGVICEPVERGNARTAIFVNAGRDYHIGWARVTVTQARTLAARGIASLRFDASGIGDSCFAPAAPEEILYSERQIEDVRSAIDFVESYGFGRIALVGRCSGAYAAFNASVMDERVRDLVMINNERFVWDPDESIGDALRYAHRSIGDLGATLRRPGGIARLFRGDLRFAAVTRYLTYRFHRNTSDLLAAFLGSATKQGRLYEEVHRRMNTLARRGVRTSLVYSEGDIGLREFQRYFGAIERGKGAYPNFTLNFVCGADHNFTHKAARERLLETLEGIICA